MRYRRVRHASGKVEILKATFYTILAIFLAFPTVSFSAGLQDNFQGIFMNGQLIGVCETEAETRQAYLDARQQKSAELGGLAMYNVDVTFGEVMTSTKDVQTETELRDTIYAKLDSYKVTDNKQLAYTVKISGYTVTLASKDEVLNLLDQVQSAYDTENRFTVALSADKERESNAMTVVVEDTANTDVASANVVTDSVTSGVDSEAAEGETAEQLAAADGVVGMSFDKDIQVSETYVSPDVITDTATALSDITMENEEKGVYEVKVGDCLSTIAQEHGMSTSDLLEMNADLQVDSNILVGDEIVVTVPETPLSVVVEEQKTEHFWKNICQQ